MSSISAVQARRVDLDDLHAAVVSLQGITRDLNSDRKKTRQDAAFRLAEIVKPRIEGIARRSVAFGLPDQVDPILCFHDYSNLVSKGKMQEAQRYVDDWESRVRGYL